MWAIIVTKNPENIAKILGLTGTLNFVIRVRDFKKKGNQAIQRFCCQGLGHKTDFYNLRGKCVKCTCNHSSCTCDKDATLPAKCVNCNGDLSVIRGVQRSKRTWKRRALVELLSSLKLRGDLMWLPKRNSQSFLADSEWSNQRSPV